MLARVLLAALSLFAGSACATVFISENWDSGTPPSVWPYKQAPSACDAPWQGNTFNGWDAAVSEYCTSYPEWANAGLSTTRAHSGTRSFFTTRASGVAESPDIRKDISGSPTVIYVRMYVWFEAGFSSFNTPTTREPTYHFFFTNSAQSMTGLRINILSKVPYTSPWTCASGYDSVGASTPYAFFSVQDYDREWPVGTYPDTCYNILDNLSKWVCYEFMLNASTNTVTMWADGTQVYTATDRITQTNFTMFQISNYMSSEDGTGFVTAYYIDDIEIQDQRINCSSSLLPGPTNPRWRPAEWDVPTWVERMLYAGLSWQ